MSRYWYYFFGNSVDETDPTKYARVPNIPAFCIAGQKICGVYAHKNPDTGRPFAVEVSAFSKLFDYAAESRANSGIPIPTSKPFVYMRPET